MKFEKQGVPSVTFVSMAFQDLARLESASQEVPDLPIVLVPHPFGTVSEHVVNEHVDALWPQVLKTLISTPAVGR